MNPITCPRCSTENAADSLKCSNCGVSLPVEGNHLESISDWIDQLTDPAETESMSSVADEGERLLSVADKEETAVDDSTPEGQGDELLDWLKDLDPDLETSAESVVDRISGEDSAHISDSLDDWAAELSRDQEDWIDDNNLSGNVEKPTPSEEGESDDAASRVDQTSPLSAYHEIEGIPEQLASQSLPDWLQDEAIDSGEFPDEPHFSSDFGNYEPSDEASSPLDPKHLHDIEEGSGSDLVFSDENARAKQEMSVDLTGDEPDPAEDDWYSELAGIDVDNELDGMLETDHTADEEVIADQIPELIPESTDESQIPPPYPAMVQTEGEEVETAVPDWLQALKPNEFAETDQDELIESAGILAGIKGVLPIATSVPTTQKTSLPVENPMSVEQRRQVALLKQLTTVEESSAPSKTVPETGDRFLSLRIILGIVLLSVVTIGWFAPLVNELIPGLESQPIPIETLQALTALEEAAGKPVLVAFEYTPSYADELDPVALTLLAELASNRSAVVTISQYAAAVPVAQRMTEQVADLDSSALGYLPGDATGLRRLGSCLIDVNSCDSIPGLAIDGETQDILLNVSAIIVLTAERDSIVNWIEQVGTQKPVPLISGITQALSPMATPYLASNQLAGSLAGMPAAAAVAQESDEGTVSLGKAINSLTLAQWLSVIVLVAGAIYFGVFDLAIAGTNKMEIK